MDRWKQPAPEQDVREFVVSLVTFNPSISIVPLHCGSISLQTLWSITESGAPRPLTNGTFAFQQAQTALQILTRTSRCHCALADIHHHR
jgi:hypothetical protein